jgi:hypothetical protein
LVIITLLAVMSLSCHSSQVGEETVISSTRVTPVEIETQHPVIHGETLYVSIHATILRPVGIIRITRDRAELIEVVDGTTLRDGDLIHLRPTAQFTLADGGRELDLIAPEQEDAWFFVETIQNSPCEPC